MNYQPKGRWILIDQYADGKIASEGQSGQLDDDDNNEFNFQILQQKLRRYDESWGN